MTTEISEAKIELSIENRSSEINRCTGEIVLFLEQLNENADTIYKFKLVIEEIVTNIIKYAFIDNKKHEIFISAEVLRDRIIISFIDDGREFNPKSAPKPDTFADIEKRPIGGLGIFLVKSMMSEIIYLRKNNKNILKLVLCR
ncbi:MAG: ATP-binding protein [Candidatus Riflebacteria bacterium]|nr:ATP-binding protein [Candidatus Riflebacteria bacterium]